MPRDAAAEEASLFGHAPVAPDATAAYGEHPDQVVDFYLPHDPAAPAPLVVLFHGGAWRAPYDRHHLSPFAAHLAARGLAVALPEYRRGAATDGDGGPAASGVRGAGAAALGPHDAEGLGQRPPGAGRDAGAGRDGAGVVATGSGDADSPRTAPGQPGAGGSGAARAHGREAAAGGHAGQVASGVRDAGAAALGPHDERLGKCPHSPDREAGADTHSAGASVAGSGGAESPRTVPGQPGAEREAGAGRDGAGAVATGSGDADSPRSAPGQPGTGGAARAHGREAAPGSGHAGPDRAAPDGEPHSEHPPGAQHLAGRWPETFDDIAAVVDRVPRLVGELGLGGVDAECVVLAGHSAGGHAALWAAARHRLPPHARWHLPAPPPLRGVVALAPIADLSAARALRVCSDAVDQLLGDRLAARLPLADPAALLPTGVPTVLVQGGTDADVPPQVADSFAAAGAIAGEPPRVVRIAAVGHFPLIDPATDAARTVADEIARAAARPSHP
ncbi:alpha/beta hydrolase [Streptomyces sp. RTd22]|uniref:alpha/beta hydrolase family protein n=1 Tax=Streptomyces sp. RTd22 TaxID=1841249 RepID=UPI0007C5AE97